MADFSMKVKIKLDEDSSDKYFSDLTDKVISGKLTESEAIELVRQDFKQFIKIEVACG